VAKAVHRLVKAMGMKTFAYDPYISKEAIEAEGATYVATVPELFERQYVTLHVPLNAETKNSIDQSLLKKLPKNGTLINTARMEVVHEADLLAVLKERSDICYLADVPPTNAKEIEALVGDKFMKRVIFTKKKMGAQTLEANNNAGVAAANQIVNFFEKGDVKFQVKA